MLNNLSISILKFLKSIYLTSHPKVIYSTDIAEKISRTNIEVVSCLKYLEEQSYLELIDVDDPIAIIKNLTSKGLNYEDFMDKSQSATIQNFNINSVANSAFGNIGNITINNGMSFDDARQYILNKNLPSVDEQLLIKLTEYIETLVENKASLNKGFLSKFSDVISKHSWVPALIGNALIKYFTNPQ